MTIVFDITQHAGIRIEALAWFGGGDDEGR